MDNIKALKKIMEKSHSNRILILTNNYQILGNVYECDECNKEWYLNLTDVHLCEINNLYDGICEADVTYDWLHINIDKIVAFSFI